MRLNPAGIAAAFLVFMPQYSCTSWTDPPPVKMENPGAHGMSIELCCLGSWLRSSHRYTQSVSQRLRLVSGMRRADRPRGGLLIMSGTRACC